MLPKSSCPLGRRENGLHFCNNILENIISCLDRNQSKDGLGWLLAQSFFGKNIPPRNLLDAITLEVLPQRKAAGLCDRQESGETPKERQNPWETRPESSTPDTTTCSSFHTAQGSFGQGQAGLTRHQPPVCLSAIMPVGMFWRCEILRTSNDSSGSFPACIWYHFSLHNRKWNCNF